MSFVEKFKKHWLITGIFFIAIFVVATWKICLETRVEPKNDIINHQEKKIADLEKQISKLESEIKILKPKPISKPVPFQKPANDLETKLKRIEKRIDDLPRQIAGNREIKKLEISNIYYRSPGSTRQEKIIPGQPVESDGEIWFEIKLPELGGYLIAFLKDSSGKLFNLFPGTKQAVMNGYYRVPYHLNNPHTEIQKVTANNTIDMNLPLDRILIGGYTFDETKGQEIFHFYYLDKRENRLEEIIKDALEIGKDITHMKGILDKVTPFDPRNFEKKINRPLFYRNELKLKFKHK